MIEKKESDILKNDADLMYVEGSQRAVYVNIIPDSEIAIRVAENKHFCVTSICQNQLKGNRKHKHDIDESWCILKGKFLFEIEDSRYIVEAGGFVTVFSGQWHKITSLEDGSVRLAISRKGEPHIYEDY